VTTHEDSQPASPHYQPLIWTGDETGEEHLEIEAHGDDWTYTIRSVTDGDEIIGYEIRGGDMEESDTIGSLNIDGERGERTLQDAKAAAQANYADRYLEAEDCLFRIVSGYEDDEGRPLARRGAQGRLFCRVEKLGGEIEIAATLVDDGDFFDATAQHWAVCPRSINHYSYSGDWLEGIYDDARRAGVLDPDDSQ